MGKKRQMSPQKKTIILHDTNTKQDIHEDYLEQHDLFNVNIDSINNSNSVASFETSSLDSALPQNGGRLVVVAPGLSSASLFSSSPPGKLNFAQAVNEERRELLDLTGFQGERSKWQPYISAKSIVLPERDAEERSKKRVTYVCLKKKEGENSHTVCPPSET